MKVLNVTGEVIPVTTRSTRLYLKLANGTVLKGEHVITNSRFSHKNIKRMYYVPAVDANPRAVRAIRTADTVVIGPGNHYSSIVPNLLIPGIKHALRRTRACVVYVCNLTNKRGQTDGYSSEDYANDIVRHLGADVLDYMLVNTRKPSPRLMKKYLRQEGSDFLVTGARTKQRAKPNIIFANLLSTREPKVSKADAVAHQRSFIRHDSDKLARAILSLK